MFDVDGGEEVRPGRGEGEGGFARAFMLCFDALML